MIEQAKDLQDKVQDLRIEFNENTNLNLQDLHTLKNSITHINVESEFFIDKITKEMKRLKKNT